MKNELLRYFTSDAFRSCISEHYDELTADQKHSIITSGKVDLKQKLEDMKKLRDSFADEEKNSDIYDDVIGNIADYERLVSYMTEPKPGTVFVRNVCTYDRESPLCTDQEGWAKPFASFESVIKSIRDEAQDEEYDFRDPDYTWFFIQQFELADGEYKWVAQYVVLFDGTVVEGDFEWEEMRGNYWMSVLVLTPFEAGDIIHVDFRPFRPPFNAVILRKESFEDGYDCAVYGPCTPKILYIDHDGDLTYDTLAGFYSGGYNFSPVPSVKLPDGELWHDEEIIGEISRFIRENPNGADIIEKYCNEKYEKREYALDAEEIRGLMK